MELVMSAALLSAGLAMLCFGGNWLVEGGVAIARRLGISPMIIGMTVVAYGTSTPELAAGLAAGGQGGIILGNVVGSNIANVGMVIAVSAVMVPLAVKKSQVRMPLLVVLGASALLFALSADGGISWHDGALMLALLGGFTAYTYKTARRMHDPAPKDMPKLRPKPVILLAAGLVLLYFGAGLTVDNAVLISEEIGLSKKVIGLTVIAVGTSLPELITSVIAIRKGHADIGIGNIIGSNIYNILMIIGITSAVSFIAVPDGIALDYVVMIAFGAALFVGLRSGAVSRTAGAALAAGYAAYLGASLLL